MLNATAATAAPALDPAVRVYAHCGTPPSPDAADLAAALTPNAVVPLGVVMININATSPRTVHLNAQTHSTERGDGPAKGYRYARLGRAPDQAPA